MNGTLRVGFVGAAAAPLRRPRLDRLAGDKVLQSPPAERGLIRRGGAEIDRIRALTRAARDLVRNREAADL